MSMWWNPAQYNNLYNLETSSRYADRCTVFYSIHCRSSNFRVWRFSRICDFASSSARLAIPEVVDRPCWNRVESAYWSGDFQKIFFLFDPSLTSGMSVVLMWGHCLRHRPYIKQHMSAGRVAHRKRLRHRPPHLTATCMRVELMVSQRRRQRANIKKTFFEKLMSFQYLNLPPYPNRWMVWLIQQGLAWQPRCVKTCCQEDVILGLFTKSRIRELSISMIGSWAHKNNFREIFKFANLSSRNSRNLKHREYYQIYSI